MASVVTLIESDHDTFEWLFTKLEDEETSPDEKAQMLEQLEAVLVPHSRAEEAVVYPAISKAVPKEDDEVKDGAAEHHHVDGLMAELKGMSMDDPGADGILAAMIGELRHHIEEEEEDIFPEYEKAVDSAELERVGQAFVSEKEKVRLAQGLPKPTDPDLKDLTVEALERRAQVVDLDGRSGMTKDQLIRALTH